MERHPILWLERFNHVKIGILPNIIQKVSEMSIKIQDQLRFHRFWQVDTKIHIEVRETSEGEIILKKKGTKLEVHISSLRYASLQNYSNQTSVVMS